MKRTDCLNVDNSNGRNYICCIHAPDDCLLERDRQTDRQTDKLMSVNNIDISVERDVLNARLDSMTRCSDFGDQWINLACSHVSIMLLDCHKRIDLDESKSTLNVLPNPSNTVIFHQDCSHIGPMSEIGPILSNVCRTLGQSPNK